MLIRPIADSYWVERGSLLAGAYPGSLDVVEATQKLHSLLDAGVSVFIDLTEDGELNPYMEILGRDAHSLGVAAQHQRRPIGALGVPTASAMISTLDAIDDALKSGVGVYLHCAGGVGRTGTVVGCYLVRHGLTGVEALEHLARLRQGTPNAWMESPVTSEQRQMVLFPWRIREVG